MWMHLSVIYEYVSSRLLAESLYLSLWLSINMTLYVYMSISVVVCISLSLSVSIWICMSLSLCISISLCVFPIQLNSAGPATPEQALYYEKRTAFMKSWEEKGLLNAEYVVYICRSHIYE